MAADPDIGPFGKQAFVFISKRLYWESIDIQMDPRQLSSGMTTRTGSPHPFSRMSPVASKKKSKLSPVESLL
jgi:hypothetical protein